MERPSSASSPRRSFLSLGIALTLLGSLIVAAAIAMPGWQILDLPELNAIHEHAIFYDCILSEITPLDALRRTLRDVSRSVQPSRRCTYKFATGSPWETAFVRMAIEEGDFAAREHLNLHRFLPQHKAVIFFCVFTLVFGLFSAVVGACSSCFVPNAVLHVISLALAASCSLLADFLFFLASQRDGNRRIQGDAVNYQQHLSYAFFIHCLGSLTLVLALLASIVAAYLLLAKKCREWKHRKTQECLMEEANDANKHDRCLFLSDVLALRPRAGTGLSLEVPQLPPPPPTPQQCQQQHLRLTGRCKEKGLISRSDFNEANPCPSSMLLSPKSSAGSSYCYSAV